MTLTTKNRIFLWVLLAALPLLSLLHLISGQIDLSWSDLSSACFAYDDSNLKHIIFWELRVPRVVTALIAGAGLSMAGLLMQTLFNNPLAGPYVLGINSGASLFVAFAIMTGVPIFASNLGLATYALLGALLFGLIIAFFASAIRQQISLLLIGLMLGSFTSAIISIIQSSSGLQELKLFTLWALGSLQKVTLEQIPILVGAFLLSVLGAFLVVKPLNMLVLGSRDAELLGVRMKRTRLAIIFVTALITGVVTAFCGPIAFVGLAVPNLIRIVMKTQRHGILLIACLLSGSMFLLLCDLLIQYLESQFVLPINALTSLIGAPFVILLVLRRLK